MQSSRRPRPVCSRFLASTDVIIASPVVVVDKILTSSQRATFKDLCAPVAGGVLRPVFRAIGHDRRPARCMRLSALVAARIGVTVPEDQLAPLAVLPFGVMAIVRAAHSEVASS